MKLKTIIFITILLILTFYSSEISFMPNYIDRPDKWHLFFSMLGFYFLLMIEIIWSALKMIKLKKVLWFDLITLILTLICFTSLNNSKGNSQEFGYIGLILLLLILLLNKFLKKGIMNKTS